MKPNSRSHFLLFFLCLVTTLLYAPFSNSEYIYDDYDHIHQNETLNHINSMEEVVTFHLQPSRPVSNVVLAFSHWFSNQSRQVHRHLSLLLHLLVTLLLYLNLRVIFGNLDRSFSHSSIALAAALFYAAPIQSGTVQVITFRWEILAMLFTLLSSLLALKLSQRKVLKFGLVSLTIGGAALSKETYLLFCPLWLFLTIPSRQKRAWGLQLFLMTLPWMLLSGILLTLPSKFPYANYMGWDALPFKDHVYYAGQALLELLPKTLFAYDLSTLRLTQRFGIGHQFPPIFHAGILIVTMGISFFVFQLKAPWRGMALFYILVSMFYLLIPNVNIGIEHYSYPATIVVFVLFVYLVKTLLTKLPIQTRLIYPTLMFAYLCYFNVALLNRLFEMETRLKNVQSQLERHPESPSAIISYASLLMADQRTFSESKKYIDKAKQLAPHFFSVLKTEFHYYFLKGDWKQAETLMNKIRASRPPQREWARLERTWSSRLALDHDPATHE